MGRANNFDALRLIAALMVLLAHTATTSNRPLWVAVAGVDYGRLGVLIFFSISGYLVTASWRSDPDIGRFLAKRFLRVAPGLMVAVPVTFLVVLALGLYGFPSNPLHRLNGSLWTIEYEVQCYLLLAALMMAVRHPVAVGMALCIVGYLFWPRSSLVLFAPYFAMGAALYEYPKLRKWSWAIVGLGIATMPYRPALSLALVVAPLSIWIGTQSWPVLRSAGRYGDMSYGVYIYAFPIQQIAVAYLGRDASYYTLALVALAAVLPFAWLSWHWVEKPAITSKPRPQSPANNYEVGSGRVGTV